MSKMRRRLLGMMQSYWYVTDGLVLHMDGIEKGATANAWTSLVGGHVFTPVGGVTFNDNNVELDGVDGKLLNHTFITPMIGTGTIELVVENEDIIAFTTVFSHIDGADFSRLAFGMYQGAARWTTKTSSPVYPVTEARTSISANKNNFYVNGVAQTSNGTGYVITNASANSYIGCRYNHGFERFFAGNIHSIRIYNRLLTQAEVFHNLAIDRKRFGIGYPTT